MEIVATAEEGMERSLSRGDVDLLILDQRLPSGASGLHL